MLIIVNGCAQIPIREREATGNVGRLITLDKHDKTIDCPKCRFWKSEALKTINSLEYDNQKLRSKL